MRFIIACAAVLVTAFNAAADIIITQPPIGPFTAMLTAPQAVQPPPRVDLLCTRLDGVRRHAQIDDAACTPDPHPHAPGEPPALQVTMLIPESDPALAAPTWPAISRAPAERLQIDVQLDPPPLQIHTLIPAPASGFLSVMGVFALARRRRR